MKNVMYFIDREEKEILRQADNFQKALTHLRYEGKVCLGKNAKAANRAIQKLGQSADRHDRFQSGVIFPFLEKHFPRHVPAVHLLQAEHDDILKNKKKTGRISAAVFKGFGRTCLAVQDLSAGDLSDFTPAPSSWIRKKKHLSVD